MNDELVTANAAVVSKLLVIAPYSAARFLLRPGVQTGEKPRQYRSADYGSAGLIRRALSIAQRSSTNIHRQVAKVVITSAAFVCSDARRRKMLGIGIFSRVHKCGIRR